MDQKQERSGVTPEDLTLEEALGDAASQIFDFALRWGRMVQLNAALTAEVAQRAKREQFLEDNLKDVRRRLQKYQTAYAQKESALKALQDHHDEMKKTLEALSSVLPMANPTSTPAVATAPPPLNTKPVPLSVKQKRQAWEVFKVPPETAFDGAGPSKRSKQG